MLSSEDNELLCRVGRGTPMGDLLRQYWMPCLPSTELPDARRPAEEGAPARRGPGRVPRHAGARSGCWPPTARIAAPRSSSAATRSAGSAASYHGWKFDVTGRCVDMPNEPEESTFKDKVRARAYPCRDVNGVIWTYMGPRADAAAVPAPSRSTRCPPSRSTRRS